MKPIKPSHREKKRYLLLKGKDTSKENLEKIILEFLGILGYSETNIYYVKSEHEKMIVSINNRSLDKIRTSLLISGKEIKIVKVSGSLKKLK